MCKWAAAGECNQPSVNCTLQTACQRLSHGSIIHRVPEFLLSFDGMAFVESIIHRRTENESPPDQAVHSSATKCLALPAYLTANCATISQRSQSRPKDVTVSLLWCLQLDQSTYPTCMPPIRGPCWCTEVNLTAVRADYYCFLFLSRVRHQPRSPLADRGAAPSEQGRLHIAHTALAASRVP